MKESIQELAIFGGTPAFAEVLHVGKPNIGDRAKILERMNQILESRVLANRGPFVHELEARLAKYLGVKHCITVCNGTVALEIAARALNLRGEVIVPAFTFIATAHALKWQEITPVFCDIDPVTCTIDPKEVEKLITPNTTGIIGVHLWGRACDVDALQAIADKHKIELLFDAAHAIGCTYKGKRIGGFGHAEVFSFHATKILNTFEGGAIATDDDALAEKIKLMQNFGFGGYDKVIYIGTNGKMCEVSAAMGLTGLECLDEFISVSKEHYDQYGRELAGLKGLSLVEYDKSEKSNYHYVAFDVDEDSFGMSRDDLVKVLHAENVLARRYFFPGCHRMEPYCSTLPTKVLSLPVTERLSRRVLCLPNGTAVSAADITKVTTLIRGIAKLGGKVRAALNEAKS